MIRLYSLLFTLFLSVSVQAQDVAQRYPLIPYPTSLTPAAGQFIITARTALIVQDNRFSGEANQLQTLLEPALGKRLSTSGTTSKIVLQYDVSITNPEGYHLTITPRQVTLKASQPVGMFRAVQTIRQLLPVTIEKPEKPLASLTLPAVQIQDQPAYAWRGMHLDVSRHFYSMEYLH